MEKQSSILKYNFAAETEFTYQVSLMLRDSIKDNIFYHVCGGAIISKSHILTAAHCVFDINPPNENYMVLTGSNDLNYGGQLRTIMKILIHPKYHHEMTNSFGGSDIATITVSKMNRWKQDYLNCLILRLGTLMDHCIIGVPLYMRYH